jgi:hypothetical protein
VECRYDPANLSKNKKGWSFFDEKDLQAAIDNSYQVCVCIVVRWGVFDMGFGLVIKGIRVWMRCLKIV